MRNKILMISNYKHRTANELVNFYNKSDGKLLLQTILVRKHVIRIYDYTRSNPNSHLFTNRYNPWVNRNMYCISTTH